MGKPIKIGVVGAGSAVFSLGIVRDLCLREGLHGSCVSFMDVDEERLCPKAWLIQSANPVFEGCTLMTRESGLNIVGLCHGHYGYHRIAGVLGLETEHVTFEAPGFNHCIWMTTFEHKGEDAYPLIDEWIETKAEEFWRTHKPSYGDNQMSRAAIHQYQLFGLMPIGDTPRAGGWWYHVDLETKKRWYGHLGGFDSEIGWAQYLKNLEDKLAKISEAARNPEARLTEIYPPNPTREQIVPIIDALTNGAEGEFQVNVPNDNGRLEGVPTDVVVETAAVVNANGIRGHVTKQLPRRLMLQALQPRLWRAECMLEAYRTGDRRLLLTLLLDDHRTRSLKQAEDHLDALFAMPLNRPVAERFGS